MKAFMALLFFGCFIVSLTLAPDHLVMPLSITSLILLTLTGFYGIYMSGPAL